MKPSLEDFFEEPDCEFRFERYQRQGVEAAIDLFLLSVGGVLTVVYFAWTFYQEGCF
jgi:hypothetical protein